MSNYTLIKRDLDEVEQKFNEIELELDVIKAPISLRHLIRELKDLII